MDFVSRHCGAQGMVPVLIAHNGRSFDLPWLAAEFGRAGLQLPADWHFLDTCQLAKRTLKGSQGTAYSQVIASLA